MLAKQGWRLISNPNSLVAQIFRARYYSHGDVFQAKLGSSPSYTWRSIFNGLEVVKRGTRWRVGNGERIFIPTTYKVISPPRQFDDYPRVSVLIDRDTKRWKDDVVRSLFLPFEAKTILNIPLCHSLPEDQIIWVGNKNGEFSVKSAYYIATRMIDTMEEGECSSTDSRSPLWRKLWHLNIPPKVRIFAWKMCMNALPTYVNLQKRGVNICDFCPACGMEPESNAHVFIKCEVAKRVWRCWLDCPIDLLNINVDIVDIALEVMKYGTPSDLECFFLVAWAIWQNRNTIVHEFTCQFPKQIWNFAANFNFQLKSSLLDCPQNLSQSEGKWLAPSPGVFKINVDGATYEDSRNSSVGVVIRDAAGKVHVACCKYLQGQYSVEEVEALAMECGLLLAKEYMLPNIVLESDALNAVVSVSTAVTSGCLGHIYQGIRDLLSSFNSWKIKHVKKDGNRAAHELAQYARMKEESCYWKGVCPPLLDQIILENGG